jgi:hypothetical protein
MSIERDSANKCWRQNYDFCTLEVPPPLLFSNSSVLKLSKMIFKLSIRTVWLGDEVRRDMQHSIHSKVDQLFGIE